MASTSFTQARAIRVKGFGSDLIHTHSSPIGVISKSARLPAIPSCVTTIPRPLMFPLRGMPFCWSAEQQIEM